MTTFLIFTFSSILSLIAIGVLCAKDLLSSIVMVNIFSLISVIIYVLLMAPDVAITEAAVGSAISSVFYLITISITGKELRTFQNIAISKYRLHLKLTIGLLCFLFAILFSKVLWCMRIFGDTMHKSFFNASDMYIKNAIIDFNIENIVTAILGGYRGFDTLFEVAVILTSALGVRCILKDDATLN